MEKQQITKCPYCKSEEVVRRGYFQTQTNGKQQRYYCKGCKKKFIQQNAFYRMRNEPKKITLCLDLFYRGVSTRKIQEHLQSFYPHNSSHKSIYKWIIKYSKVISRFTDKLKVKVGSEIQIDEIEYHRRKSHKAKKGIDKNWFIDSVCPETKFMVASEYVKARERKEVKAILKRIIEKTDNQVSIITTDAHAIYENVVSKTFGYNNKTKKYNVFHNKVNARGGEGFNHPIERLHNSLRARTKTMRGFHGSLESANAIMKGLVVYYNFITKHQSIDCCPYELAIPELKEKLNVNNKWLALVELANQKDL